MIESVGWATVLVSLIASLISAGVALVVWQTRESYREGRLSQQVNNHEKQLERHEARDLEILGRLNALERGYAAMPGQISGIFDERIEKLREYWEKDMEDVVHKINREEGKE